MTVHDRTAKLPCVSVASFQALRKMEEECLVSMIFWRTWKHIYNTVHVAQLYIIESQESIGTRLATVQV